MPPLTECVLDTSALLALINDEPGADKVRPLLAEAVMSAVNVCETVYKLRRRGMPVETVRVTLAPLVRQAIDFDEAMAYVAASIHERTRDLGISLADCACLALALSRKVPAVTTEKTWEACDVGVQIIRIR
jgi:PIN domain nuclease of toxin-antitoxin system